MPNDAYWTAYAWTLDSHGHPADGVQLTSDHRSRDAAAAELMQMRQDEIEEMIAPYLHDGQDWLTTIDKTTVENGEPVRITHDA